MATTSDTLEIVIRLRDKASRGLKTLGRGLGAVRGRIGNLTKSLTGLKAAIATVGAGLIARSFIQAADASEQYRVRLNVLLGSTKEGSRAFKEMADYASTVSYSYEEIMGSATALAGVMSGGVDEIKEWMPLIADLAAVAGVTVQEATGQIIKMYSAGAGAADLFRDRGILAMLGFKAKTAYTAKETKKIMMDAFTDPASKFRDVSLALAKTWSGMLSMMGDRWFQFRNMVMEDGGVIDFMKAGVQMWLDYTDRLKEQGRMDEWAAEMGVKVLKVFGLIAIGVGWIGDAFRGLKIIINGIILLGSSLEIAWGHISAAVLKFMAKLDDFYISIMEIRLNILKFFGKLTDEVKDEIKATEGLIAARRKLMAINRVDILRQEQMILHGEKRLAVALATIQEIAKEVPHNERIKKLLAEMTELAKKYKEEREKTEGRKFPKLEKPKDEDTKLVAASLKAEAVVRIAENRTMLAAVEADWAAHNITMEQYFEERLRLMNEQYDLQMQLLRAQAAATTDPSKKKTLLAQIAVLEQRQIQDQIKYQQDYTAAVKESGIAQKEAAEIVAGIRRRVAELSAGDSIGAQQKLETDALLTRQKEEIDAMLELKAAGYDVEKEMQAAQNAHLLEQEQLAANQKKEIWDVYISSISDVLGDMTSMFLDFYKASGEKHKELFNLFKAASIAQALIATYTSATKAYNAMVEIPIVGPALAATAAAVAIAAGMAKVQLIRQQQMAGGGEVLGVSPHARADNINISATAGEFMQPVPAVKYYTRRGMEAIRRMLIPPEIIQAFAAPGMAVPHGARLASGGVASSASGGSEGPTLSMETNVMLPEQLSFIGRRLESEIEPVVVRVLQEELKY